MNGPKYPEVVVRLVGEDANAFAVLGRVLRALREAGVPEEQVIAYRVEATSGSYQKLLAVTARWVTVE